EADPAPAAAAWTAAQVGEGRNACDAILADAGQACLDLLAAGQIDGWRYKLLEERLNALSHAQGSCERIKGTPVPFAYSLLLHRTAYLFCLMLPFGLVGTFGLFAPLIVAVVGYTFFGLDALGDELEDPFGLDPNDLPLDALVRTVERDVLCALGEVPPPPLEPRDCILT
ncbi:MAG: bestrophin family ion channel, partial [Caulobacteraceae bacterium]